MDPKRLERLASKVASVNVGKLRTAGKIEFVKDTGPVRRDIRVQDFNWSPDSLRELSKILWASQRAQSYAMAAFRLFSKMPSAQISPDGLLGGKGYIQNIKEMRTSLAQATEVLSAFTDTVDDEINGSHWKATDSAAEQIQQQADEVKSDPSGFVEEEFRDENPAEQFDEPVDNPNADDYNPHVEEPENEDEEGGDGGGGGGDEEGQQQFASRQADSFAETAQKKKRVKERKEEILEPGDEGSQLPGGTGPQGEGQSIPEMTMHTTTPEGGNYASSIDRLMAAFEARTASRHVVADSSVDPGELTGPRIKHIGPGEGDFNDDEQYGSDDPAGDALNSGVETTRPIYEGYDAMMDGTTGLGDPYTESNESVDLNPIASKVAAAPQTYSWLPGADNSKNLDYYALGMTEEDLQWLRAHSDPDPPPGLNPKPPKPQLPNMWEPDI